MCIFVIRKGVGDWDLTNEQSYCLYQSIAGLKSILYIAVFVLKLHFLGVGGEKGGGGDG